MIALGLGSNVGEPLLNLRRALAALAEASDPRFGPMVRDLRVSPLYRSDALLPPDSPPEWDLPFVNLVVVGRSAWTPRRALQELHSIERRLGRGEHEVWSPRTIDIDLLLWNGLSLDEDDLRLPHPRIAARPFVVYPLCDLLGLDATTTWIETAVCDDADRLSLQECAARLRAMHDPLRTRRDGEHSRAEEPLLPAKREAPAAARAPQL